MLRVAHGTILGTVTGHAQSLLSGLLRPGSLDHPQGHAEVFRALMGECRKPFQSGAAFAFNGKLLFQFGNALGMVAHGLFSRLLSGHVHRIVWAALDHAHPGGE
ncbi:hypothetical protein GCM10009628_43140 [Paeniglutamicibacter kerguelensis]